MEFKTCAERGGHSSEGDQRPVGAAVTNSRFLRSNLLVPIVSHELQAAFKSTRNAPRRRRCWWLADVFHCGAIIGASQELATGRR